MSDLIIMQRTTDLLAQRDPKALKALGESWVPCREGDDRYFKKTEDE